jgi:hypothetical protein
MLARSALVPVERRALRWRCLAARDLGVAGTHSMVDHRTFPRVDHPFTNEVMAVAGDLVEGRLVVGRCDRPLQTDIGQFD